MQKGLCRESGKLGEDMSAAGYGILKTGKE